MNLLERVKRKLRRRSLTPEDLAERQEAEVIREQMLKDRITQYGYRPGGR